MPQIAVLRWHTVSLLGSLRSDGSSACMLIESAMDAKVFMVYVEAKVKIETPWLDLKVPGQLKCF